MRKKEDKISLKHKMTSNCFQLYYLRTGKKEMHTSLTLNPRVWCPFVDHSGRILLLTAGLWDRGARQRVGRWLDGGGVTGERELGK